MGGKAGIAALGAVVALVLEVVLAPNLAIAGTAPSFVVAYSIAIALLVEPAVVYIIAFCLGMCADLLGFGPVGALSFILLIAVLCASRADASFGNGTVFVSCIVVVVFVVCVHFLHAAFMAGMTSSVSAADAFSLIAAPKALYDSVLAVLLYVALRAFLQPSAPSSFSGTGGLHLR